MKNLKRGSALRQLVFFFGLMLFFAGCASGGYPGSYDSMSYKSEATMGGMAEQAPPSPPEGPRGRHDGVLLASADDNAGSGPARGEAEAPQQQRIMVYNAAFKLIVKDIDVAIKGMEALANSSGGYVQRIQGTQIVFRIPANKYQQTVEKIEQEGEVVSRNLEALDVTEQFVDLQARIDSNLKLKKRLEELLAKAANVTEAIEVERELGRVSEMIERLQGKMKFLQSQISFSTFTLNFERVKRQQNTFSGRAQLPFSWVRGLQPISLWEGY